MLKDFLDKLPPLLYDWQYDFIKRMGHRSILTNIRRSGKTILFSYLAVRFILRAMPHITTRPVTVIFVGESKDNVRPFFRYLEKIKDSFGDE